MRDEGRLGKMGKVTVNRNNRDTGSQSVPASTYVKLMGTACILTVVNFLNFNLERRDVL